jgi:hypothetical protein
MNYAPSDDLTKEFDDLELETISKTNEVPKERLTDPKKLRSIHMRLFDDDRINARNRALCQSQLDGEPPYVQSELDAANQPDTTNLNFGGAEERLERAKAPYYRLLTAAEELVAVKTLFGQEDERADWEAVMSEEISKTIRDGDTFEYETDRLIHKHVFDGVGILHWSDDIDWRYKGGGLGQFYFPRKVAATESKQSVVTAIEEFSITDLYEKIKDPENAEKHGWNVEATMAAIRKATSADPNYADWERLVAEVKNNDLFVGNNLPVIRVIHGWVKEMDGTVSHYMVPEADCDESGFMYCERNVYKSMTEALVLFPYGAGTNTLLHGIRGLGYKMFPFEEQRNRSIGRLIDKGMQASTLMLQASDETDMANIGLTYYGDLAVLPPGVTAPNIPMPDLQRSVMPAIELMDRLVSERTSGYSSENVFDGDQRKTKAEVMAHLEQAAELSDSALGFFYKPGDRAFQQVVRRMTRRDYLPVDPGGPEIADLKLRLLRRGVPLEAFYKIDWKRTRVVRVMGSGSAAAKTLGLQRMGDMYPRMDDVGQQTYNRDVAIDALGTAGADRYFPKDRQFRTTVDTQIAINQNFILTHGGECPVLASDKHLAHAREHIKPLLEMYQLAEGGQMGLAEAATTYLNLYTHTVEHVQAISGDAAVVEEVASYNEMLQRVGEIIHNGVKEAEQAAQDAEAAGQEAQAGPSPESVAKLEEARANIRRMEADAATARQIKIDDAQTNRAIKDASAAADIQRKNFVAKHTVAAKKTAAKKKAS